MKIIKSVEGIEIKCSDEDYPLLSLHRWSIKKGYAKTTLQNKTISMHRLVCRVPSGMLPDHINRDKLDNRRENLRPVTAMQNAQNSEVRFGKSLYIGVRDKRKSTGKWEAYANVNNKEVYIGRSDSELECAEMRDAFVYIMRGEFAFLNFPEKIDIYEKFEFKNKKLKRFFQD